MIHRILFDLFAAYCGGVGFGCLYKPKLPTVLVGWINGGAMRLESPGVSDSKILLRCPLILFYPPIENHAVTHIQYDSPFGWLLMWPLCFYFWRQTKFQERRPLENNPAQMGRIPGTERGQYGRLFGWRYDFADKKYIFTKGQFGFHFD